MEGFIFSSKIAFFLTFLLGAGIGALVVRFLLPNQQTKRLEQQLQATEEKLARYQEEVHSHFVKTSDLINNLTATYRDLHEHLSVGAYMLAQQSLPSEIAQLRTLHFPELAQHEAQEVIEPHLPYTSVSLDQKDASTKKEESYA